MEKNLYCVFADEAVSYGVHTFLVGIYDSIEKAQEVVERINKETDQYTATFCDVKPNATYSLPEDWYDDNAEFRGDIDEFLDIAMYIE